METLTYAEWLEAEYSERRIMDMQDLMWELWDVYRGEDGALYVGEKVMTGSHFGEWAMWAEVEKIEEAL